MPLIPNSMRQDISDMSNFLNSIGGPVIDNFKTLTGIKFNPKIGYGIDILIQGGKDLNRDDCLLLKE